MEGLSTCVSLQELQANAPSSLIVALIPQSHTHLRLQIVDQRMGPDETLSFDPRTLHGLSGSLAVLDISKNNVREKSAAAFPRCIFVTFGRLSPVYFCNTLRM